MRGFENISKSITADEQKLANIFLNDLKNAREAGRVNQQNPISASRIVEKYSTYYRMNINDVTIRKLVNYLRKQGEPVGSNYKGYWYMIHPGECDEVINHLQDRVSSIAVDVANLKNIKMRLVEEQLVNSDAVLKFIEM